MCSKNWNWACAAEMKSSKAQRAAIDLVNIFENYKLKGSSDEERLSVYDCPGCLDLNQAKYRIAVARDPAKAQRASSDILEKSSAVRTISEKHHNW